MLLEFNSAHFIIGTFFLDWLEGWTIGLVVATVLFDLILGLHRKVFASRATLQAFGVALGYFWASYILANDAMFGGTVWMIVIGGWAVFTPLAHVVYLGYSLILDQRR